MRWAILLGFVLTALRTAVANSAYHYDNEGSSAVSHQVYKYDDGESSAGKITLENDIEFDNFESHTLADDESKSHESSDETDKPAAPAQQQSTIGKIFSSIFSVPRSIFRAIGSFFTSAPLSRLREEVKNLNISYPKK